MNGTARDNTLEKAPGHLPAQQSPNNSNFGIVLM